MCPSGGGQISCNQQFGGLPPTFGPPTYDIELSNCGVTSSGDTALTFNGTVMATGQPGDLCVSIPSDVTLNIPNLTVESQSTNGTTTATFTGVSGSVSLGGQDTTCTFSTATFKLVGTMTVVLKDSDGTQIASTEVDFGQDSSITITVMQYDNSCVPTVYDATVQGAISFKSNGNSFAATFTNYMLDDNATSGDNVVKVSGGIASDCLGADVQLLTQTDLVIVGAVPCPHAGAVVVMSADATDLVSYTGTGGVDIDLGNNGDVNQMFGSCLDPPLFQCPAQPILSR